ncbi:MAG: 50S ribosome-binding protein YggL [Bacteroidota bacterium]
MRQRLRKKKHLGEFAEWGVPIAIKRNRQDDFDGFLNDFIVQAVEGNDCYFGGGGKEDRLEGVIELGKTSNNPEERLKKVIEWIEARKDVKKYAIGKITDLWRGSFEEIDAIGEKI